MGFDVLDGEFSPTTVADVGRLAADLDLAPGEEPRSFDHGAQVPWGLRSGCRRHDHPTRAEPDS